MSGLQKNGTDLDAVFDPYVQGTKPALTGIQNAGQDVRDRYAPIVFGTSAAATGITVNGADLNTLFAAYGSASYTQALVIPFGNYSVSKSYSHNVAASMSLTLHANGTWDISLTASPGGGFTSGTPRTGNWHSAPAAGVGSEYEVRFTAAVSGNSTDPGAVPTYTPTTGWLTINADRTVEASTGMILDGSGGQAEFANIGGSYTVEIRKIGGTEIKTSVMDFDCEASSDA